MLSQDKYKLNIDQLKQEISNLSLNVVIASNREALPSTGR
jgi:hypothetical protein